MNPAKMLIVALTRFYGIVLLFYGIFYSTYLGPFYHRLIIIYENPATHAEAARIFGVASDSRAARITRQPAALAASARF